MTTYVLEISNPRVSDGKPYERSEVETHQLRRHLSRELGRELTSAELVFITGGAKFTHEDQTTGRTITAYRKAEKRSEVAA
jgi:hypothetical protein